MIYGSISRRYAKALFDLGEAAGTLLEIVRQVELFNNIWGESRDMRSALTSPMVPMKVRREIVTKTASSLGASEPVLRFLRLLVDKGRIESIGLITLTLKAMTDRKEGVMRGEITSAFPLDPPQVDAIVGSLEKKAGKKIFLTRRVDPDLIGGIVIKLDDRVIDGSVRSRLEDVRKTITGDSHP
jgi:F-type H+-transporting ATPase subunit delta